MTQEALLASKATAEEAASGLRAELKATRAFVEALRGGTKQVLAEVARVMNGAAESVRVAEKQAVRAELLRCCLLTFLPLFFPPFLFFVF